MPCGVPRRVKMFAIQFITLLSVVYCLQNVSGTANDTNTKMETSAARNANFERNVEGHMNEPNNPDVNLVSNTPLDNSNINVDSNSRPENSVADNSVTTTANFENLSLTTHMDDSETLMFLLETVLAPFVMDESNNQGLKGGIFALGHGCPEGTGSYGGKCAPTENPMNLLGD